jgi:eukaryotic-like serine/threonine-protein kinase
MSDLLNYIKLMHTSYSEEFRNDKKILYANYYSQFDNSYLVDIFALFHSSLNDLFSFMNVKRRSGGHYNAAESRVLISLIEEIKIFKAKLSNEYSFDIDDYYMSVMNSCKKFLTPSGGSTIPTEFEVINIIEDKPIFTRANNIEIQSVERKRSIHINQIGGGSYAKVFKYKDPHYNTEFAIKRALDSLREDELVRFRNEYNDMKKFDSPFIIKAYTYNEEMNEYTMELADQTLEKFMKYNNANLSLQQRRNLVLQLLHAFEYIHNQGLLHRDISYQNILIKKFEDGHTMIKVSDFGLVKRPESSLTRAGTEPKGAINDYSDLDLIGFENYEIKHETYALGKVIYLLLTGKENNYHREENEELRKFILKAIGEKTNRFNSVPEMKRFLLSVVFPSLMKSLVQKA